MGAYTSICLAASGLLSLTGCADDPWLYDSTPTLHEDTVLDAGPTSCALEGKWEVRLSTTGPCAPPEPGAVINLTVSGADAGSGDFAIPEPVPSSPCGAYSRKVELAANGCTITASSLASWCSVDKPQCSDYQLTLHVRDDTAYVDGSYRKCWCGSPSAYGKKVEIVGSAVRL